VKESGIYILLLSVHGLIRGQAPELGRDPDTGGQVLYVLELAKALAKHPEVAQVDLLTCQARQTWSGSTLHPRGRPPGSWRRTILWYGGR